MRSLRVPNVLFDGIRMIVQLFTALPSSLLDILTLWGVCHPLLSEIPTLLKSFRQFAGLFATDSLALSQRLVEQVTHAAHIRDRP
jgi:hypothetical protein